MIQKNSAIWLYIFVSVLYIFAVFFSIEKLAFSAKIVILPAIAWYTLNFISFQKNSWIYLTFFLFYFGDLLMLFYKDKIYLFNLLLFILAYFCVVVFVFKNLKQTFKESSVRYIDYSIILAAIILFAFLFVLFFYLEINSIFQFALYILLAVELYFLAISSAILNFLKTNMQNFLLAMTVLCFVLSDLFYVFYTNFTDLKIFEVINVSTQTLSYLFLSNYFIQNALDNTKE